MTTSTLLSRSNMQIQTSQSGWTLFELLSTLFILSTLSLLPLSVSQSLISKTQLHFFHTHAATLLEETRFIAKSRDCDALFRIDDNHIVLESLDSFFLRKIAISPPLTAAINHRKKLGFKHNGNTKYSGTLTLQHTGQEKTVTLGVGYGKIGRH